MSDQPALPVFQTVPPPPLIILPGSEPKKLYVKKESSAWEISAQRQGKTSIPLCLGKRIFSDWWKIRGRRSPFGDREVRRPPRTAGFPENRGSEIAGPKGERAAGGRIFPY